MYISDVVRRSSRSLKSAKLRTILTALAIAVGGFTLTMTLAAGNGIREYTSRLVASNFDPSELIVGRDEEVENSGAPLTKPKEYDESVSSLQVGNNSSIQIKQVTDSDIKELKKQPYIEQVRENYQLSPRYITREGQKKYTLSAQAYIPSQKPELESGALPESGDLKAGEIAIPAAYVEALSFSSAQDAIGKTVQVNIQEPFSTNPQNPTATNKPKEKTLNFKVVAVTKRSPTSIEFGALPVLFSNADARQMYDYTTKGTPNYGKYTYVFTKIKDGQNEQSLNDAQTKLKDLGYYTQSSKDIQQSITQIVNILQTLVGVFAVVTLVASIFGIINTQYISVLERTREIGLMKALGMRKRDVGRLFRFEAAWIGFLGGVMGALAALIVGLPLNPWITQKLKLGEGNSLLVFKYWQIIILVFVLVIVAMLAGYLPSRKAAKLDPIEALRTE